jgi:hypothetical protein
MSIRWSHSVFKLGPLRPSRVIRPRSTRVLTWTGHASLRSWSDVPPYRQGRLLLVIFEYKVPIWDSGEAWAERLAAV